VPSTCAEIDDRVRDFLARPIEGDWPYLWLDATCVKVREAGRVVPVAVTIAVGVNGDGRREVLGMAIGTSEAETFLLDFLRSLSRRGLRGVKLVISGAHEGLKAAVSKVLRATWQHCQVHFVRSAAAPQRTPGSPSAVLSPPGSAPHSPRRMLPPPMPSGAALPTNSARRCRSWPS
jgi:transposase-like protein